MLSILTIAACNPKEQVVNSTEKIKLITLDPGHFHAALVQKSMCPEVDSTVHVYAPEGDEPLLTILKKSKSNIRVSN